MNYDLAIMALEGLSRSPLTIRSNGGEVVIEAEREGLKELARLFLLLGSGEEDVEEEFELEPPVHVSKGSPALRLRVTKSRE